MGKKNFHILIYFYLDRFYKLVSEMIADDCNPSEAEESDGSLEVSH